MSYPPYSTAAISTPCAGNKCLYEATLQRLIPLVVIAVWVACSGCFSTYLGEFETPPQLESLVESASTQIPLSVTHAHADRSHGYQFLFIIFPVARVFPDHMKDLVADKLKTYAGFGKVGLIEEPEAERFSSGLAVKIEQISINGYDLLVTRRPAASVTLHAQLYRNGEIRRDCRATGSFSEFTRFAFAEDLKQSLEKAVDTASRELLECLGIFNAHEFQRLHGIDLR